MSKKFIIAVKKEFEWHYGKLYPYLNLKYDLIDSCHTNGKESKKSESFSQFLFANPTKELEVELSELGMEWEYRTKMVKLK